MFNRLLFIVGLLISNAVQSAPLGENKMSPASTQQTKQTKQTQEAIFAMGCFWCGESEFRNPQTNEPLPGILSIRVGYAGGTMANPTYENHQGYKEAVKIVFSPTIISYEQLLDIFWHNVDPFDGIGQFCDRGYAYTSVIYGENDAQMNTAEASKEQIEMKLEKLVATEIKPKTTFVDAEEYHQNYKHKNPLRYKYYRWSCGRDQRLEEIWRAHKKS